MSDFRAAIGHIILMQLLVAAVVVDTWANGQQRS